MRAGLALALLLPHAAWSGTIFRCADAGAVSYQEQPCSGAGIERAVSLPEFPPVNVAERERLLQREAALDARLLKRAELEAAERIAREARRARELELEAERERAKPVEPAYVIPVFVRPYRPRPPRLLRFPER
jgi:hypothetical protein